MSEDADFDLYQEIAWLRAEVKRLREENEELRRDFDIVTERERAEHER